jgi:hypothetical protein
MDFFVCKASLTVYSRVLHVGALRKKEQIFISRNSFFPCFLIREVQMRKVFHNSSLKKFVIKLCPLIKLDDLIVHI